MEEDPAKDLMVPLQEALLMNDASTRRANDGYFI